MRPRRATASFSCRRYSIDADVTVDPRIAPAARPPRGIGARSGACPPRSDRSPGCRDRAQSAHTDPRARRNTGEARRRAPGRGGCRPGALCGVVGFKPTYGRVSRYGLIAFASSLDQIGPFTRSVEDCALVMNAIAGYDPCDSTSLQAPVPDYTDALGGASLKGVRLALPREYFSVEGMEPTVEASVKAAIEHLESLGAELGEVSLPHTQYGLATYYLIAPAEASANLARYDGIKYSTSLREPGDSLWDVY